MFHEDDGNEYRQRTLTKSALGNEPGPQVVADALLFIMNNAYTTGRSLPLDGGRHVK